MFNSVHRSSKKTYWQRGLTLVGASLFVWLVATMLPLFLAQWQVSGSLLGWPLVFALAAFVVPMVYLTIIGVYCLVMDRFDAQRVAEQDREASP